MDRKSVKRNLVKYMGLDFNYNLTNSSKKEKELVKNIKSRLKAKLLPRINIFKDFKILFGQVEKEGLGTYIYGSSCWKPTFIIDLDNTIRYGQKFNLNYELIMETTILHELAHAIQDKFDMELDEIEAEDFAYDYFNLGIINEFWKKRRLQ